MVGGVGEHRLGNPGFCSLYFFFAGHVNLMGSKGELNNEPAEYLLQAFL
jgi:hypothetical protein